MQGFRLTAISDVEKTKLRRKIAKTFKNLLLQNQKAYDFETWCEPSVNGVYINHDPMMTLTYFTARST